MSGCRGSRSLTPVVAIVGIFIVSILTWWLLGDPKWSVLGARAHTPTGLATKSAIVSCLLFWTIFGHIFTGFTFGNWPFSKLPQPMSGLAQVAVNIVIGIAGTLLFTSLVFLLEIPLGGLCGLHWWRTNRSAMAPAT